MPAAPAWWAVWFSRYFSHSATFRRPALLRAAWVLASSGHRHYRVMCGPAGLANLGGHWLPVCAAGIRLPRSLAPEEEAVARYPNIADHGLIGDLQTAALVTTDGVLDWF